MVFELEKEMMQPVKSWLERRQGLIKEEFRLPWGYCDLVGCSLNKKSVSERAELNQKDTIGPQSRVKILWEIPEVNTDRSISQEELVESYKGLMGKDFINKELVYLEERNFVVKSSGGGYQKINGWFPLQDEIVAIELKLKDVKEAFQQAISHQTYADEAYVALPRPLAEQVSKSDEREKFLEKGLGLLGVSNNWCYTVIQPKSTKAKNNEVLQAHCVERFWRQYIKSN